MNIKQTMKLNGVTERTIRRWVALGLEHEKDKQGKLVFDPTKVAEYRIKEWSKRRML